MRRVGYLLPIAVIAVIATGAVFPSIIGTAFAHSHLVVTPDETDHAQMNANDVVLTMGHSNEPTFGAKPGIHDGKHNFELSIEDEATTLPLAGANLTLDRYYFRDFRSFERASSVESATEVDTGIPLSGVFGEPGVYSVRQVVNEGIYGYRIYGTIDYFGVAQIPIDSTMFCASSEGDTSKFNSPGWEGTFGCVDDIDSMLFPENNSNVLRIDANKADGSAIQQAGATTTQTSNNTFQILAAGLSGVGVAAFFAIRKLAGRKEEQEQ